MRAAEEQAVSEDLNAVGQRLLAAEFPHPVVETRLIETHISWVVLTGPWAYKVKKPIRLEFLDYSTRELRERCCERELEINRHWAPQIYRDLVPIFQLADRPDGGLRVGVAGERAGAEERLVDHAVRMLQFPQAALLSERLAAGEISADQTAALGEELAELHRRLPVVPYDPELVHRGALRPALASLTYLLKDESLGGAERSDLRQVQDWMGDEIRRLTRLLEARAARGLVREYHGDLHLGNVLFWEGRFQLFDGIEFNDAFRQIDGWNEIAFLAMELSEHGFRPHSRRLIDAYAEASGDYEGLALLRFFLVHRAMVRAMVDRIRQRQTLAAAQGEAGDSLASGLSPVAKQYVRYALRVIRPLPPELWITYGLSGSGKSTHALRLVESRGYLRIRSDVQRKRLAGREPLGQAGAADAGELYGPEMTARTYAHLRALAEQVLRAGFGVILDATYLARAQREPVRLLARELGVPVSVLLCHATNQELERRLLARTGDPSDATPEVLRWQMSKVEPPGADEGFRIVDQAELASSDDR